MASAVARPSAIDLLEEAVDTLRAAPLATLVYHWIGSVPFALALLVFWNDMTSPGAGDATCAGEALPLALLLAWMNCWRAVFAGRIQRQLARTSQTPWTRPRIWRLITSQVFLGGTKLVVLPLAISITLPLPSTVAFYRNAAALADRDDLDFRQILAQARKLAAPDQRQGWGILLLLAILYLVLVVNLAILLAVLPQLVRILTGYESVFSRGGPYFARNSLFWLATLAVAWIAFDPFIQAVYCIRYFRLESRETGHDLRAALRAVLGTAPSTALRDNLRLIPLLAVASTLAWGFATVTPAQLAPADLDRAIRQTLRSSDYAWRAAPPGAPAGRWRPLAGGRDRPLCGTRQSRAAHRWRRHRPVRGMAARQAKSTVQRRTRRAARHCPPLEHLCAHRPDARAGCCDRVAHAARPEPQTGAHRRGRRRGPVNLRDDHLLANQFPEDRWMALAEDSARQGDLRSALRALYLANLAWLGRGEWIAIHPGKTNREYELEVRRKARGFPEACALFAANIASFERAWYGMHEVTAVIWKWCGSASSE